MIMYILTFLLVFATIAGFLSRPWWLSIVDFFRLHYACVALILLCSSILYMDWLLMAANTAVIAVNMFRIRHFLPNFNSTGIVQQKKIMSVNAYKDNKEPQALAQTIHEADPDVLLIMEMTGRLQAALLPVLERYSYSLETPVRDGFKICLFSKNPLDDKEISHHGPGDTPLLHAKTHINGKLYQVFSAHPKPALNGAWHREREIYFSEVEKIVAQVNELPVIMMGDFNAVPWEPDFQRFLKHTGLQSTIEGYGYHMTWPVFFPLLGVPMDHILISRNKKYDDLHIGPYVGSDHYPISLNL